MSADLAALNRFPRPQASLVGRASETQALLDLLRRPDVRLITLTGPGGVGKTRLALHAGLTAPGFSDGRWFVELAGIRESALILPRIVQALDLPVSGAAPLDEQIAAALDGRDVLLVLDNFEHLLDGSVALSHLLAKTAGPTILTTSRARLNLAGEHVIAIGPLDLATGRDAEPSEAVQLFVQRSQAIRPGYVPGPDDLQAIEAICAQLSGLPLAIELAAARTRVMAPQALRSRLERPLRLLTAGPSDAPDRHRSLRDAIDWSHRLLDDTQQAVLRVMATFAGSAPLDGIEAVAAASEVGEPVEVLDAIERLVDASMAEPIEPTDDDLRFQILAPVREFVIEASDDDVLVRLRDYHLQWIDALTERYETYAFGPEEHLAYVRMRADLDNIRAAIGWAFERGNLTVAARIVANLWAFWAFSAQGNEGRRWLDRLFEHDVDSRLEIADVQQLYHCSGMVAWSQGQPELAVAHHQRALDLARAAGDRPRQARALMWLSQAAWYRSDYHGMTELAEQVLPYQADAPTQVAGAIDLLGIAAMRLGRLDEAERLLERALAEQSRYSQTRGVIWTLQLQADLARQRGDVQLAARDYGASLPLALASQNHWAIFEAISGLMAVAIDLDRIDDALELLASAEWMQTTYAVLPREGTWLTDADRERLKQHIGPNDLQQLADQAASLGLDQIVARVGAVAQAIEENQQPAAVRQESPDREASLAFDLTPREQEVLGLLVQGLSDREIGDTLFISHGTARTHVGHVLQKLDARNRAVAVRKALELQLV